ncbi:MAG: DUF192 domain-containing protein [Aestuariivirga sp.]
MLVRCVKKIGFVALRLFAVLSVFANASAQDMMRVEPVTIVTVQASTTFSAEVADTDETRERGLMFRQVMPPDQAMLFDVGSPRPISMWMKNTYVALDMVFVRQDGTIAAIAQNTVPKSLDTIGVQEPVRGVIELAAGTAKRIGLVKGDHVVGSIFTPQAN